MVQTRAMITPSKRPRSATRTIGTQTNLVIYRGPRPETKHYTDVITYTGTSSTREVCAIAGGTGSDERVGNKIKLLRLEGMLRSESGTSMRLTLYCPKLPTSTVVPAALVGNFDRADYWVIKDWWLHTGREPDCRGNFFSIKLPMGPITEFDGPGSTPTAFRKNRLLLRIQSASSDAITGFTTLWYQDS